MRALVVGAGPGGASAALALALAGAEVQLVEKSPWPRDKTCGDGISPLGVEAATALGVRLEGPVRLDRALVTTPREVAFSGGWPRATPWGTTIERRHCDAALVEAAIAAGARFSSSTRASALGSHADGIRATVTAGGAQREVRADVAVLAEGASGTLASGLGFAPHRSRLVALRGYVASARALAAEYGLFYERMLSPGYGWIFPLDERRANVGIAVDEATLRRCGGDLRALFTRWLGTSRFVRARLGERLSPADVRGGIIPSGRAARTAPRVFLVGDAAGVADPFTAEGIFQAIATGRLAASALTQSRDFASARARYEKELAPFDRNERAARALRVTFNLAIEPYARHAAASATFADHLATAAFFPKSGFVDFVLRSLRAW